MGVDTRPRRELHIRTEDSLYNIMRVLIKLLTLYGNVNKFINLLK